MAFKTSSITKNSSTKSSVDYEAMNNYVVETAGLQERETLVGVVSGIVDLGDQLQPDAEYEFDGTEEDEAAEIEKHPSTYFKDGFNEKGKSVRLKCFPQPPKQAVVLAIDFPDIIIDKGQFFGKSNPQPLRMFTGGSFYNGKEMVVAKPSFLKVNKALGDWSFDVKHQLHRMAVAAKLVKPNEPFVPDNIDQLLGKAFQFEVQVYFKESKGKKYFTEHLKFVGALGRGQTAPELETDPFIIEFNGDLSADNMLNLRHYIINTIKQAGNYEGSKIQQYLENNQTQESSDEPKKDTPKPTVKPKAKSNSKPVESVEDDDVPF